MAVSLCVRSLFAACLILGLSWAAGLGCRPPQEPTGVKAEKFRQAALVQLQRAKSELGPLAAPGKSGELRTALRKFYRDSLAKSRQMPCGLAVLDDAGVVLGGSYPDPKAPDGVAVVSGGGNYSQYDKIKQAINGRANSHFTLYTADGTVYMICSPLKAAGKAAGAVCLAFFADTLHNELGVSDKDFAALNFN